MSRIGWIRAGFLPEEAREFEKHTNAEAVFNSIPARLARRHRKQWVIGLLAIGWSKQQIQDEARRYYNKTPFSTPWDHIRMEYRPGPREKKDFQKGIKAREEALARVAGLYR